MQTRVMAIPLRTVLKKINDNFAELDVTNKNRDINGSVFADDSTLLVDAVNGTITASVLVGTLPALNGSNLTNLTIPAQTFASLTGTSYYFSRIRNNRCGNISTRCIGGNCITSRNYYISNIKNRSGGKCRLCRLPNKNSGVIRIKIWQTEYHL